MTEELVIPERKKSTHRVEVVPVKLESHPDADSLSIVRVHAYQVVVRTQDWQDKPLGAYIVPDSVVDTTRPEFAFLGAHPRIRVKKLRGVVSQGLLVPAPTGSKLGDDVAENLGVTRYEPPEPMTTRGEDECGPEGWVPIYDVESWFGYPSVLTPNEEVVVTEKIHGASARYRWFNDRIYAGSRTNWKKESSKVYWWKALEITPEIIPFCQAHPDWTLYGEVYGQVQDLTYGLTRCQFIAFDIWNGTRWLNWDEVDGFRDAKGGPLPWVPLVHIGPYEEPRVRSMADGKSIVAGWNGVDQIREGVVVRPLVERSHIEIGRVQLKLVSDDYLMRKQK